MFAKFRLRKKQPVINPGPPAFTWSEKGDQLWEPFLTAPLKIVVGQRIGELL